MQPELLLDVRADLGEGPAWEPHTGNLYWVDIHAGYLHLFHPFDGTDLRMDLGEFIGCAAPRRSGGLVLGLRSGFAFIDSAPYKTDGSEVKVKARSVFNPELHLPGNRFNDGKCDPAGRFLAGTMDDAEQKTSGSLYSLDSGGKVRTLITEVNTSNGLTWSPDYRIFYYIDTPTRTIMAYDYDLGRGEIANPRPAISVPPELGWPDGMTSDTEGMVWVAMWGGAKLTRWDPSTGKLVTQIPLPALNVSSCVFGGPDLNIVYVTTARKGMNANQLVKYPLSGGLFRIQTNIQGLPTFEFGG